MRCMLRGLLVCLIGSMPQTAYGLVAVSNGNYFSGYTDLEMSGRDGSSIRVGRTYNSRAQFLGMFGYGWGNDFDTFLIPSADGSVVIQESGGGETARFQRPGFNAQELEFLIRRIVEARAVKPPPGLQFNRTLYQARLMQDANFRDSEARELGQTRDLPVGTVLYSSRRGKQRVTRTASGYIRDTGNGSKEYFERKGTAFDQGVQAQGMRKLQGVYLMTKVENLISTKGYDLTYEASGKLQQIIASGGRYFQFTFGRLGLVTEVKSNTGETALYEYCPSVAYNPELRCQEGDLTSHKDASGSVYRYAYDRLHNLIETTHPDLSKEKVEYYQSSGDAGAGGVKSVVQIDGTTLDYDYWENPADPKMHYRTTVLTTYSSGNAARSTYEYWDRRRQDGSKYRHRLTRRDFSGETETIYNECCEQPEKVTANGIVTEYEYFPDTGLLKEQRTDDDIRRWEYHQKFPGKIVKHTTLARSGRQQLSATTFEYDSAGRLASAKSASGQGVVLKYDLEGRINVLEDEKNNRLLLEYDAHEKPTKLVLEGVGAISVTYDARGRIADVQADNSRAPAGRAVAIKVAALFQTLLELIKPAEISAF